MQGFDPSDGDNLLMDQSIVLHPDGADAGGAPFSGDDMGALAGYQPPQNLLPPNLDSQEATGAQSAREFGGRERSATLTAASDLHASSSSPLQQEQIQPRRTSLTMPDGTNIADGTSGGI